MNIGYTILDPKHKKYQIGTMFFEYEEEGFLGLKRIGFIIDNEKFFVNTAFNRFPKQCNSMAFY